MLGIETRRKHWQSDSAGMRRKFYGSTSRSNGGFPGRAASAQNASLRVIPLPGCADQLHICDKKVSNLAISPCPAFHRVQHVPDSRRIGSMSSVPHSVGVGLALISYHQRDDQSHHDCHPKPVWRGFHGYKNVVHVVPSLPLHRLQESWTLTPAAQGHAIPPISIAARSLGPKPVSQRKNAADHGALVIHSQLRGHIGRQSHIP